MFLSKIISYDDDDEARYSHIRLNPLRTKRCGVVAEN